MKAIAIIEMPDNCSECPFNYDTLHCMADRDGRTPNGWEEIPEFCPLKPIPVRSAKDDYAEGWNACIDYIEDRGDSE